MEKPGICLSIVLEASIRDFSKTCGIIAICCLLIRGWLTKSYQKRIRECSKRSGVTMAFFNPPIQDLVAILQDLGVV
jgi:hypothetical protein